MYGMPARVSVSAAWSITGSDRRRRPLWPWKVASGASSSRATARASARWIHASGCSRQGSRRTTTLLAAVRKPVAEPDLQALNGFLHRAAERQRQPGAIGLVQHDGHVLLGPRHAGELGALVHRPVLRARTMQRLAQLLRVDAERFAEAQAFVVRRGAGPEDEVVDHLADLAGARGAEVEDVRGKGAERRPAAFACLLVAGAEDEELAFLRRALAARERRIEQHDLPLAQALGQFNGIARRYRGTDGDDQARSRGFHDAACAVERGFDLVVEADDDDHDVARLRHFARRAKHRDTERGGVSPRRVNRVVAGDAVPLGDEMLRHRRAHLAQPEHSNSAYCVHRHVSASIASRRITTVIKWVRIVASLALAVVAVPVLAQSWPTKPVRFVLSLGPGSGADIGARLYADRLTKMWGHPVVVENRPGGDGVIAINAVIQAKDDHALLWGPTANFVGHPYSLDQLPYDPKELVPVARVSEIGRAHV